MTISNERVFITETKKCTYIIKNIKLELQKEGLDLETVCQNILLELEKVLLEIKEKKIFDEETITFLDDIINDVGDAEEISDLNESISALYDWADENNVLIL